MIKLFFNKRLEKLTWTKLNTFGDKPCKIIFYILFKQLVSRYGHSSAIVNEMLYIFGGFTTIDHTSINDLWRINLSNQIHIPTSFKTV